MYTAALTRFYRNKDPKVSVWVARAHYDAKDDDSCKRALLKAIHSFPDDQALYFNLALTMQHYASTVRPPFLPCNVASFCILFALQSWHTSELVPAHIQTNLLLTHAAGNQPATQARCSAWRDSCGSGAGFSRSNSGGWSLWAPQAFTKRPATVSWTEKREHHEACQAY